MNDKIYYFSNNDNQVHNINDHNGHVKTKKYDKFTEAELFYPDYAYDVVILYAFDEIVGIMKSNV